MSRKINFMMLGISTMCLAAVFFIESGKGIK